MTNGFVSSNVLCDQFMLWHKRRKLFYLEMLVVHLENGLELVLVVNLIGR